MTLDADFHEATMRAADNPVLLRFCRCFGTADNHVWIGRAEEAFAKILDEHRDLLAQFETQKWKGIEATLSEHILADNLSIDFESFQAVQLWRRRSEREGAGD